LGHLGLSAAISAWRADWREPAASFPHTNLSVDVRRGLRDLAGVSWHGAIRPIYPSRKVLRWLVRVGREVPKWVVKKLDFALPSIIIICLRESEEH
jgi:hypothetical protein